MAQGRDLFAKVEPLLNFGARILRLLPFSLVDGTYWTVQWMPGVLGYGLRYVWAKALAKSIGRAVKIGRHTIVRNWRGLELGDHCGINEWCYLDAIGGIRIGAHTGVGHHASIVSFEHCWDDVDLPIRPQPLILRRTTIGRDCMITMGVRVLAGKNIGDRVIVAANSVVTKDLLEPGIYGGMPAKKITSLPTGKTVLTQLQPTELQAKARRRAA